jgi:hypothetical protein
MEFALQPPLANPLRILHPMVAACRKDCAVDNFVWKTPQARFRHEPLATPTE